MRTFGLLVLPALGRCAAPDFYPRWSGTHDAQLLDADDWSFGLSLDASFDSLAPLTPASIATPNLTRVPSSFDAAPPGVLGPRGAAFYRRTFDAPPAGARQRLWFGACSFYCRVFVDGAEVGESRAGGYSAFWLDLPPATADAGATTRELFVLADNRFNATTAPLHTGGDFWHYGGLLRSVVLHTLPPSPSVSGSSLSAPPTKPNLWRAYVTPSAGADVADGLVDIELALTDVAFGGDVAVYVAFDVDDDAPAAPANATLLAGRAAGGVARFSGVAVPAPRVWSLGRGELHRATFYDNSSGAVLTERFGLRAWGRDEATGRVTLNGAVVPLHGWNHHTQARAPPCGARAETAVAVTSAAELVVESHTSPRATLVSAASFAVSRRVGRAARVVVCVCVPRGTGGWSVRGRGRVAEREPAGGGPRAARRGRRQLRARRALPAGPALARPRCHTLGAF